MQEVDVQNVKPNILDDYGKLNAKNAARAIQNYELDELLVATAHELRTKQRISVKRAALNRLSNHPQALALREEYQREAQKGFTILLIGQTGAGKSATVNSLFDDEVAKTNELDSETKSVTPFEGTYHNVNYTIYDTPGLGEWDDKILEIDSENPELIHVLLELHHEYLSLMIKKCPMPDVVWYVLKLDNNRLTLADVISIRLIHKYFGDEIWNRTMIVCTHADKCKTQEDFQKFFNDRTEKIDKAITKITQGNIQGIPAVAVSNGKPHTPDGKSWLGRLFVTSLERLNPDRKVAFLLAFAMDLEIPKPQQQTPKVQQTKVNNSEEIAKKKGRIDLTENDLYDRFIESSSGVSEVLTGVLTIGQFGATIDLFSGGATMGIPIAICSIIGGIAGFINWLHKK